MRGAADLAKTPGSTTRSQGRIAGGGRLAAFAFLGLWPFAALAGDEAASNKEPPLNNPVAVQSLRDLSATLSRPLFAPSRRKFVAPAPAPVEIAAPPSQPPAPPPAVKLVGIVSDPQGQLAVLRAEGEGKEIRVRVGDIVESWKVSHIAERGLTLSLGERDVSLAMFAANRPDEAERRGAPLPRTR